jgi:hypothetical protein
VTRKGRWADLYLDDAERATAKPGRWVNVRTFSGKMNAAITAWVMEQGYIRSRPRRDQQSIRVGDNMWMALPADVETAVEPKNDGWLLRIKTAKDA